MENQRKMTKELRNDRAVVSRPKLTIWQGRQHSREMLSRTDVRHVVVLAECRQVLVQFLDALLVSLDAFAHQLFFQL